MANPVPPPDTRKMLDVLKASKDDLSHMAKLFVTDDSFDLAKQAMDAATAVGRLRHHLKQQIPDVTMDWTPSEGGQ